MSRADKTQTEITYDLILDEADQQLLELRVTMLTAMRSEGCGPTGSKTALTTDEHVAFLWVYRLSDRDAVEKPDVPEEAAKLLR